MLNGLIIKIKEEEEKIVMIDWQTEAVHI